MHGELEGKQRTYGRGFASDGESPSLSFKHESAAAASVASPSMAILLRSTAMVGSLRAPNSTSRVSSTLDSLASDARITLSFSSDSDESTVDENS